MKTSVYAICADDEYFWSEQLQDWVTSEEEFTISTNKNYLRDLTQPDGVIYMSELPTGKIWDDLSVVEVGILYV